MPLLPAIEYAERSDPGRAPNKQVNEDACGHRETRFGHLCVVCDGMGGHAAGREAARLALATMFEVFDETPEGTPPDRVLRRAIEEASRRVYSMCTSAVGHPGSTVVAVLMHADGTEVAHVGDSRAYLVHEGQIVRLTRDHSIVQELVDCGMVPAEEAAQHPVANRITRSLGTAAEVEVDLRDRPVRHVRGDKFVLCSDGLSDLVEDQEILAIVASERPVQAVERLVDEANARGGNDNITALVLVAHEPAVVPSVDAAPLVTKTLPSPSVKSPGSPPTTPEPPKVEVAARPTGPVVRLYCEVHDLGDGRFELVDNGTSGTLRLNGAQVRRGVLTPGDVIDLGYVKLKCVPAASPRKLPRALATLVAFVLAGLVGVWVFSWRPRAAAPPVPPLVAATVPADRGTLDEAKPGKPLANKLPALAATGSAPATNPMMLPTAPSLARPDRGKAATTPKPDAAARMTPPLDLMPLHGEITASTPRGQ